MSTDLIERPETLPFGWTFDDTRFPLLSTLRNEALKSFRTLGLPTTKDEEWRYTSLRLLDEMPLGPVPDAWPSLAEIQPMLCAGEDQLRIVFVNGSYSEALTTPLGGNAGLDIRTFGCAAENVPHMLQRYVGALAGNGRFALSDLNTSLFENGAYVHVAANTVVPRPIHILHVSTGGPHANFPRNLLIFDEGAEAFVLESYASLGDAACLSNAVTEVFVAAGAKVEHVKAQRMNLESAHIALTEVRQERDSSLNTFSVNYGARLARNDLNVFLNGSNLHSRVDGVVALRGDQHCDNHTKLDHAFPHCDSFQVYKHVLADKSTGVFNGKIYVHQDAQKTDAKQTNQTLLLSPTATINSKPQLEIFADDVKCTHGATVGRLREDALFYLRSRGLPLRQAQAILVYAFAAEVLEKITNEGVRLDLERQLFETLGV